MCTGDEDILCSNTRVNLSCGAAYTSSQTSGWGVSSLRKSSLSDTSYQVWAQEKPAGEHLRITRCGEGKWEESQAKRNAKAKGQERPAKGCECLVGSPCPGHSLCWGPSSPEPLLSQADGGLKLPSSRQQAGVMWLGVVTKECVSRSEYPQDRHGSSVVRCPFCYKGLQPTHVIPPASNLEVETTLCDMQEMPNWGPGTSEWLWGELSAHWSSCRWDSNKREETSVLRMPFVVMSL